MVRVSVPGTLRRCRITRTRTGARSRGVAGNSANPSNTAPGSRRAISSSRSAAPSGRRRSASQACTSLVLTFRKRANTACDAWRVRRSARSRAALIGAGAPGSIVLRRSRLGVTGICYNVAYYSVVYNKGNRLTHQLPRLCSLSESRGRPEGDSEGNGMVMAGGTLRSKFRAGRIARLLYITITYTLNARFAGPARRRRWV